jgi:hypothetical protein
LINSIQINLRLSVAVNLQLKLKHIKSVRILKNTNLAKLFIMEFFVKKHIIDY